MLSVIKIKINDDMLQLWVWPICAVQGFSSISLCGVYVTRLWHEKRRRN